MKSFMCGVVLACITSVASANFIVSGTISSADGQIDGTGIWIDKNIEKKNDQWKWEPAVLNWSVSLNEDNTWHYSYSFDVYRADVSHIIIQTATNLTYSDIMNLQGSFDNDDYELGLFKKSSGNPNMPTDLFGIKFDLNADTNISISFDSLRAPMWGDFYAKGGKVGGVQTSAWNDQFVLPDEIWEVGDPNMAGKILVPGTDVPEPAVAAILMAGFAGLAIKKLRPKRA